MSTSSQIDVWGIDVDGSVLSASERAYLVSLPVDLPTSEWVCDALDEVWDAFELDNGAPLSGQAIGSFYEHPVWLMNGLFSARDPVSIGHRSAIAEYVVAVEPDSVADFGGGFGELAWQIALRTKRTNVSIVEPYATQAAVNRFDHEASVSFVDRVSERGFDVAIAQDVLEHVEDPVGLAHEICESVRVGGRVIFANNFAPVIKCHLPSTFYLHRTFRWVMRAMGADPVGSVDGASHAEVYVVPADLNLKRARRVAAMTRTFSPIVDLAASVKLRGGETFKRSG